MGSKASVMKKFQWTPYSVTCSFGKESVVELSYLVQFSDSTTHWIISPFHEEDSDQSQRQYWGRLLNGCQELRHNRGRGVGRILQERNGRDETLREDERPHAKVHLQQSEKGKLWGIRSWNIPWKHPTSRTWQASSGTPGSRRPKCI